MCPRVRHLFFFAIFCRFPPLDSFRPLVLRRGGVFRLPASSSRRMQSKLRGGACRRFGWSGRQLPNRRRKTRRKKKLVAVARRRRFFSFRRQRPRPKNLQLSPPLPLFPLQLPTPPGPRLGRLHRRQEVGHLCRQRLFRIRSFPFCPRLPPQDVCPPLGAWVQGDAGGNRAREGGERPAWQPLGEDVLLE